MTEAERGISNILVKQKFLERCNGKVVLPLPEYDKYVLRKQSEEVQGTYHALRLTLMKDPDDQTATAALADLFEEIGQQRRSKLYRSLSDNSLGVLRKLWKPVTESGREAKNGKYKYSLDYRALAQTIFHLDRLAYQGQNIHEILYFKTYDEMMEALIACQKYDD